MRWSKKFLAEMAAEEDNENLVEYTAEFCQELIDLVNWENDLVNECEVETRDDNPLSLPLSRTGWRRWNRRKKYLDVATSVYSAEMERRGLFP